MTAGDGKKKYTLPDTVCSYKTLSFSDYKWRNTREWWKYQDIFYAVILWQLQSKLVLWLYTAGCDVLHVLYLWLCHLDVWHRAPYVPRYLAVLQNSQKSHTNQKHGLITIGKTGHV